MISHFFSYYIGEKKLFLKESKCNIYNVYTYYNLPQYKQRSDKTARINFSIKKQISIKSEALKSEKTWKTTKLVKKTFSFLKFFCERARASKKRGKRGTF